MAQGGSDFTSDVAVSAVQKQPTDSDAHEFHRKCEATAFVVHTAWALVVKGRPSVVIVLRAPWFGGRRQVRATEPATAHGAREWPSGRMAGCLSETHKMPSAYGHESWIMRECDFD